MVDMLNSQYVKLSSGFNMPLVGIGTYQTNGRDRINNVIDEALSVGYRSIDTAAVYRNEEDIGYALSSGLLNKYGLERDDIFLTTKLSPSDHGDPKKIRNAVETSLRALGTSYIDLYLIHWPGAARIPENSANNIDLRAITWQTLVDLKSQGFLRSIGVSNYNIKHLQLLLQDSRGVKPAVNQVECHPHYKQEELIKYCKEKGIHVQAYSSLGTSNDKSLLKDPTVCKIAGELDVSPARVLLKWALQQGIGVIPKAIKKEHIHDNIKLDFSLSESQMKELFSLPQHKYAWNPDNIKRQREMASFEDQVASLCIEKYKSLRKTGKPGENEWTVLSGIVMKKDDSLSVISLATGTKCLGSNELIDPVSKDVGVKLSDSHAEVLTRRALLRYLYKQIDDLYSGNDNDIFSLTNQHQLILKANVSFHFYSSQTPCGDCSIIPKVESTNPICSNDSVEPPSKFVKLDSINKYTNNCSMKLCPDIHRTGAKCVENEATKDRHLPGVDYHVIGPLRTKPGRGDPTLSLSCSDKLAKWNIVGLQGALLSILIPTIKFETIIIGGGCPFSMEAMERGIFKRFNFTPVKILQSSLLFSHLKNEKRSNPCPSSIIWCDVKQRDFEVAVNGRKQGATKKCKRGNTLMISRKKFLEYFLTIIDKHPNFKESSTTHPKKIFYYHCKQWSLNYQKLWNDLKATSFDKWPSKPTHLQHFSLV